MKTNYIKVDMEGLSKLNFTEKAVFSYIKSLSKDKGYCFASNKHICEALTIKDRTLYRILNIFEKIEDRDSFDYVYKRQDNV